MIPHDWIAPVVTAVAASLITAAAGGTVTRLFAVGDIQAGLVEIKASIEKNHADIAARVDRIETKQDDMRDRVGRIEGVIRAQKPAH